MITPSEGLPREKELKPILDMPHVKQDVKQAEYYTQPVDPHVPGAKLDHGKPRMGLVLRGFALALREVSKVGTFGARKYSDNGWMAVENGQERYDDALFRHLLPDNGDCDEESEIDHLAHAAWNALAVLELKLRKQQ